VTAYNTLGFPKYFLETGFYASRLAKTSEIRYLGAVAQSKGGTAPASLTDDKLPTGWAFKLFQLLLPDRRIRQRRERM
jgi:hypothetical protein